MFAVQVELVDAGAGPVSVSRSATVGSAARVRASWMPCRRVRACRAAASSVCWGPTMSRAVVASNPAARAAWYSVAMVCCSRETSSAASTMRGRRVSAPMSSLEPLPLRPLPRLPPAGRGRPGRPGRFLAAGGGGVVRAVRIWDQTASSSVWTGMERLAAFFAVPYLDEVETLDSNEWAVVRRCAQTTLSGICAKEP